MEEQKDVFPIVIKKKNGMMIIAIIAELIVALNFWFINTIKMCSVLFIFVAVITAISVWDESCENISLGEYKFEVNKRKDILQSINYEKINKLTIEESLNKKNKKRNFLTICFNEYSKKKKKANPDKEKYMIELSTYSLKDVKKIKEVITTKNPNVRITKEFNEYLNRSK